MVLFCKIVLVAIVAAVFLYVAAEGAKVITQIWNTAEEEIEE